MSELEKGEAWVEEECRKLVAMIQRIGEPDGSGQHRVQFGMLQEAYDSISDSVLGILIRAKKRNVVHYEGEALLKGTHDHVYVYTGPPKRNEETAAGGGPQPNLTKYKMMLKAGIVEGAVRQRMTQDGLDADRVFPMVSGAAQAAPEVPDSPYLSRQTFMATMRPGVGFINGADPAAMQVQQQQQRQPMAPRVQQTENRSAYSREGGSSYSANDRRKPPLQREMSNMSSGRPSRSRNERGDRRHRSPRDQSRPSHSRRDREHNRGDRHREHNRDRDRDRDRHRDRDHRGGASRSHSRPKEREKKRESLAKRISNSFRRKPREGGGSRRPKHDDGYGSSAGGGGGGSGSNNRHRHKEHRRNPRAAYRTPDAQASRPSRAVKNPMFDEVAKGERTKNRSRKESASRRTSARSGATAVSTGFGNGKFQKSLKSSYSMPPEYSEAPPIKLRSGLNREAATRRIRKIIKGE